MAFQQYKVSCFKIGLLVIACIPQLVFSKSVNKDDYWQCSTHDNAHLEWLATSAYQKAALNTAFASCKKQSQAPSSCKSSNEDCELFHNGQTTKPFWHCVALDTDAARWPSNYYTNKDDAAIAAKAFCKSESNNPDSCYVNMLTCININERH